MNQETAERIANALEALVEEQRQTGERARAQWDESLAVTKASHAHRVESDAKFQAGHEIANAEWVALRASVTEAAAALSQVKEFAAAIEALRGDLAALRELFPSKEKTP